MDETRRFIASETGRDEDRTEKAGTALVGLTLQLLDTGDATCVVLLTTDEPAGTAAEAILAEHGFGEQVEYRYASAEYLVPGLLHGRRVGGCGSRFVRRRCGDGPGRGQLNAHRSPPVAGTGVRPRPGTVTTRPNARETSPRSGCRL